MAWHAVRAAPNSGVMGETYLLCFRYPDGTKAWYTAPNGQVCGHYSGWADDLAARLASHADGNGSRLCAVTRAAVPGVIFALAEHHAGDRNEERRLKNRGGATRRCPLCRADIGTKEMDEMKGGYAAVAEVLNRRFRPQPAISRQQVQKWDQRRTQNMRGVSPPEPLQILTDAKRTQPTRIFETEEWVAWFAVGTPGLNRRGWRVWTEQVPGRPVAEVQTELV